MRPVCALLGIVALVATDAACPPLASATTDFLWLAQNELRRNAQPQKPARELNTLNDIFTALRRCYRPPNLDKAFPGMRITVQIAYTRAGDIFEKPHISFETPGISPEQQSAYRMAVAAALVRCAHLPFSDALGNAVAGRIFAIQFVDERTLRQAEYSTWPSWKIR
jgi:hypothetical protein